MAIQIKWLDDRVQEWRDMEPKFRYLLITVAVTGTAFILYQHFTREPKAEAAASALPAQQLPAPVGVAQPGQPAAPAPGFAGSVGILPTSSRNQGLEDMAAKVAALTEMVGDLKKSMGDGKIGGAPVGANRHNFVDAGKRAGRRLWHASSGQSGRYRLGKGSS